MKKTIGLFILTLVLSLQAQAFGPNKTWLRKELKRMKLPQSFITKALKHYEPKGFDTVLKLNLIGFLNPPYHMDHVTKQAVKETSAFLKKNQSSFSKAESDFKVPASVISALLWIETKHGRDLGRFHVLSVYLHLLQSDLAKNRNHLIKLALEKNKTVKKYSTAQLKKLMKERTKKRRDWARSEIKILASLDKEKKLNVKTLKGSFAGAFGLPQFLPSSYKAYAKSTHPKRPANLYKKADAIYSVANYLSVHGWSGQSNQEMVEALMKYNHSRDYADSILEISKSAAGIELQASNREPSSED